MGEMLFEKIEISKGWALLLIGITPLSVLSGVFYIASWKTDVETRIFDSTQQKEETVGHVDNTNVHFDYKSHTIDFVPRTEIDYKFIRIQEDNQAMKSDLKEIKQALNIK
jgi:hypothetical protein